MRSEKKERLEKLQMRRTIADRMSFNAIPFYAEVRQHSQPISKGMEEEHIEVMASLISKGCDRESLGLILNLAAAIKRNEISVPTAKKVKTLTSRMRRLAKDIRSAELTHFMFIVNEEETGYTDFGPDNKIEDLSLTDPFLTLPKWLEKRASMYEAWSHLASRKVLPKDFGFSRLARVCVALYVQHATAGTYFPEVLKLLESVGLDHFGGFKTIQLSREVKEFENDYSWSCDWLKTQFKELDSELRNCKSDQLVIGVRPPPTSSSVLPDPIRKEPKVRTRN
jgi:hypothetical protein